MERRLAIVEAGSCHVYLSTVPLSWPMRFTPASFFLLLTEITRSEEGSCSFARAHVLTAAVHDEVNGSRFLARGLCPAVDETSSGESLKFVMTHLGQITTRVALCASIPNDPSHPREPIHARCPILSILCRQCVPTCREIIKFSIFVVTVPVIDMRGRCRLRFGISIIFGKLLQYAKDLLQYFWLSLENSIGIRS